MTCLKRIVVIALIQVEGSLGTRKWFIPYTQYCYEEKVDQLEDCDECSHKTKQAYRQYYKIIIGEEEFLLPEEYGAWDVHDLPADFQNWREWYEAKHEQPVDMWKEVKDSLGIDIKAGNTVVHNGYALYQKIQKSENPEVGSNDTK